LFKDVFLTVWDAAKSGLADRLKQLIGASPTEAAVTGAAKHSVDAATPWLRNTPLHLAVKGKQVKAVKVLVWDLQANTKAENAQNSTPIDFCKKFIKDEETQTTMMGLLLKMHQNTKVMKNLEAKREKAEAQRREHEEVEVLRTSLATAIEAKGYDIAKMFKVFDANGDGSFDQTEFEAAFTVLDVDFKVASLRRLVALSDKNADGKIDFQEFHDMLYGPRPQAPANAGFEIIADDDDDE